MHSPPMLYAHLFAIITCLVLAMAKVGSARQATVKSVFEIPSANLTVMKRKVQVDSRVVASGLSLPKFVEAEEGKHSVLVSFYCVEVDEVTGETKPALASRPAPVPARHQGRRGGVGLERARHCVATSAVYAA